MSNKYAYAEILEVLENMNETYVKKIPLDLVEFFKKNSSSNYKKHINPNLDLKEQNLQSETLSLLAFLNLKYWVKNEIHKENLLAQYKIKD